MVGIGTIGADRLNESNNTPAKTKIKEDVAIGWTLMEINKTRDSAEVATTFLQTEIDLETKYWEDVVAVQQAGWAVCKMPNERHALGVRFGFSEAVPEFQRIGLAPLRRGDSGHANPALGTLAKTPKGLLVTYRTQHGSIGRCSLPAKTHAEAPLKERILEARDTVFARELWHELTRESRQLHSYGVRLADGKLTYQNDAGDTVELELVDLESDAEMADPSVSANKTASTIAMTLKLLLSYAHRYNELMRIRPLPPHIPRSRGVQTYALLRPIIARMSFQRNIASCCSFIGNLTQALTKAGFPADFTLLTPETSLTDPTAAQNPNQPSIAHTMIRNMVQVQDFYFKLTLFPSVFITIRGRCYLFPVISTHIYVILPSDSPLQDICAPYKDGYPSVAALTEYLEDVTLRFLTNHFIAKLSALTGQDNHEPSSGESHSVRWIQSAKGTSILDYYKEDKEIQFSMDARTENNDESNASGDDQTRPSLLLSTREEKGGKPVVKSWKWTRKGESEGHNMEDVIERFAKRFIS